MGSWNLADLWEGIADLRPEAHALVHGNRCVTWGAFDRRADGVARWLLDRGVRHHDRVALYLYNDPAYLESVFACAKAGLVPVNTNYRYVDDELHHLWTDADATAVVFHAVFAERVDRIRSRLPGIRTWLCVDDDTGECPPWATPYDDAVETSTARVHPAQGRSGTDLVLVYTGGTTGLPKGVLWQHDTLARLLTDTAPVPLGDDITLEQFVTGVRDAGDGQRVVLACPLMHSTGMLVAFSALLEGGTVVTLPGRSFDPELLLDTVEDTRAAALVIVGDAFARPILHVLDSQPERWDLSSLQAIYSAGVMWSEPVKRALLEHHPAMVLVDLLGSSEAVGMGMTITTADAPSATATFDATESSVVLTEDGRMVEPGSGEIGRLGVRANTPVGYHKDPQRSDATFPVIDGVRYAFPGDWATVESDGRIRLLGRGSVCINTGGEKVFPEEVEEALKTHPGVVDAAVVGVPDDRFGEVVTALVEVRVGATVDQSVLINHVRRHLAAYKAPRHVEIVGSVERAPNGKLDYGQLRQRAIEAVGATV